MTAGGYGDPTLENFNMVGQFSDENGPLLVEVAADFCVLSDPDTPADLTDDFWICKWRFEGISKKTDTVTFTVIEPDPEPSGAPASIDIDRR